MTTVVRQDQTFGAPRRQVHSVLHAFEILDQISSGGEPLGPSELSRRTGLSKSTIHSLLTTLESIGAVERDPIRRAFRPGWRLFELGATVSRDDALLRVAGDRLRELASRTGETAILAVIQGQEVLYIDHASGDRAVQVVAKPGARGPLHATATGKVFLAFSEPRLLDEILSLPVERFMPATICDPVVLREEIEQVRVNGYSIVREEREPSLSAVAVPVRGANGRVVAAMSVACPSSRFAGQQFELILSSILQAGEDVARAVRS
jgi:DNA-binding IclR family transcriptional regulator